MRHWAIRLMIASNQFISALLGGDPQMSLSARAAYARQSGSRLAVVWCATFEALDFHDPSRADHCTVALAEYLARKATLNP